MEDKDRLSFVTASTSITIAFLMIVNYLTSPDVIWFLYPSAALLLLAMSLNLMKKKQPIRLSLVGSAVIILFFIIENVRNSPEHPWFLYASYPVIWWPLAMLLGKHMKTMQVALIGSGITILYYSLLNAFLSPQYPWFIYPAFAVLWWPLALYYGRNKKYFAFSISGSLLLISFFIVVNAVSTPDTIWAVFPIFSVVWWPLALYYFLYKKRRHNAFD